MRTYVPLLFLWFCVLAQSQTRAPVAVEHVDYQRFMGRWYEISRLPNHLERDCARDVVATYERRSDAAFRVAYQCRHADGNAERIQGIARVRDMVSYAKLELRFAPLALSWRPFVWDDWWVLAVAPEYSYMMVGDPSRQTLWIFSRSRELDEAAYQRLVVRANAQGYDTQRLVRTPQSHP